MRLAGKAAVITGAGAGIGEATAYLFASEGARLCLNSLSDSAKRVADKVGAGGGHAIFVQGDVSVEADARRVIDETVEAFGGIDILYNNAGIVPVGSVEACTVEEFDRCMAVNVRGIYLCSRYALPHLRASRGVIVNCSSAVAVKGVANRAAYSASKGAVSSLTRAMAVDHMNEGVRVNAICPGTVDTPSLAGRLAATGDAEEARRQLTARQPLGRLGKPEEVAEAILLLATNEFCTGAMMYVDGGMTM